MKMKKKSDCLVRGGFWKPQECSGYTKEHGPGADDLSGLNLAAAFVSATSQHVLRGGSSGPRLADMVSREGGGKAHTFTYSTYT